MAYNPNDGAITDPTTGAKLVQHRDENGVVGGVKLTDALSRLTDTIITQPIGCNVKVVDLATDADVVVSPNPAYLIGWGVVSVMSAHDAIIKNAATEKMRVAASSGVGVGLDCHWTVFQDSIIVESDDAATGKVAIFWLDM